MLSNEQIKSRFAKARKAQQMGRLDEALSGYRKLIKQAPRLAEAYFNIAEIHAGRSQFAEAAKQFEAALKLRPAEPAIWVSYLQMAERHPLTDNLEALLKRSAPVIGNLPAHEFFRGYLAARHNDFLAAEPLLKSAITRGFAAPRARVEYGMVLAKLEQNDDALSQFNQALAAQPNNGLALSRKAELLRDMGQFDEALVAARAALDRTPDSAGMYYTYCSIKKVEVDDPVIAKMEKLIREPKLNDHSKVYLGHALAKAMEDTGGSNKVFGYLKTANDANARAFPFDLEEDQGLVKLIQGSYLDRVKGLPPGKGNTQSAPIFVTGLPRSGTTLVEQIISSAEQVEGGGEMAIVHEMLNGLWRDYKASGMQASVFEAGLTKVGKDYAAETARRYPGAKHVTDKSISTYSQIGLLKWAIPNAKIVVVRRDPNDNAMSIYKNMFSRGTHRYASRLEGIAQFMRLFEGQLAFWRTHCPDDFYEIRYEDLIANRETQIPALVEAVGLDWNDAFLESHRNKRKVATLSAAQVRQPIYSSSIGAWKQYAVELAPFLNEYAKLDPAK